MLSFETNAEEIRSELLDEIKLFYPDPDECPFSVVHRCERSGNEAVNMVTADGRTFSFAANVSGGSELERKRLFKRAAKLAVYRVMTAVTGIRPPWGSLTGIRPSKLVYDMLKEGRALSECPDLLVERFDVSREKAELICGIVDNQRGLYCGEDGPINLYVHIPFCVTRCSYCSFATETIARSGELIPEYVRALRREIEDALEFISSRGKLLSVYVGGGTPTSLSAEQLYAIFDGFPFRDVEFTLEAGRPDTITDEKLDAMKRVGVSRVCVNPQTLNDSTLAAIGRAHTAADFFDKYALAKSRGFDVNVDLIAGLPGETPADFERSLTGTADLRPDNITVHTLARKNGSALKESGWTGGAFVPEMTEFALRELKRRGYFPYYLYRQKQMLGNLENVGYSLGGKQCVNNVTTMEDCVTVLACGAGAITKAVSHGEKRVARFACLRDVRLYLQRFDEKLLEKRKFLQKQFTNP